MTSPPTAELYRHNKTGTLYRILYRGIMQSSRLREIDNEEVVVYQKVDDTFAPLWIREEAEFMDGRFEAVV